MTSRGMLGLTAGLALAAGLASAATAAAQVQGETVFKQQCGTCHTIAPGGPAKLGPPLKGMVGRKAATVPGYTYSKALSAWGQTWTTANLDKYLAKPSALVPGGKMLVGVANADQRAAVIAYLASQK